MANKNFPQNPVELKVSAGSRRCLAVYVQLVVLVTSRPQEVQRAATLQPSQSLPQSWFSCIQITSEKHELV